MRRAGVFAAACLVLAGCGFGGEAERTGAPPPPGPGGTVPPAGTPQPRGFTEGAREALAGGAVGVVDLSTRAAVAPAAMEVNREQRLEALRWSGWGAAQTTGRGHVSTLVCDPNCATGRRETSTAVIVLSAPRRCGGRRFYSRASMTYEERSSGRTRAPATYLRTPC